MASFAYIEPARTILELSLEALNGGFAPLNSSPDELEVPVIPCELDDTWKQFEQELGNFKLKLKKAKTELAARSAQLNEIDKRTHLSKFIVENVSTEDLKAKLVEVIDNYEKEEGLPDLIQQCGELKGKIEAMKSVLLHTNSERYARFTCCICLDRLVDLFIDPCGHVVCESCWINTRDKRHCPGCRGNIAGAKKIFNM